MGRDNIVEPISSLMEEHKALIALLPPQEISLLARVDATFAKTLLLSAASYFEVRMTDTITAIFLEETQQEALKEFVRTKAVERSYHTWFDWRARNANAFFGAFGNDFKQFMENQVKESESLEESIRAFMEIGRLRNQLVHENFGFFPLEKTSAEVFETYQEALGFVNAFPDDLRKYLHS